MPPSSIRVLPTTAVVITGVVPPYSAYIHYHLSTLAGNALTTTTVMQLPAQMDSSRSEFITALLIDALFSFLLCFHLMQSLIICMHLYIIQLSSDSDEYSLKSYYSLYFSDQLPTSGERCMQTVALADLTDAPTDRFIFDILIYTYVFVQQIL